MFRTSFKEDFFLRPTWRSAKKFIKLFISKNGGKKRFVNKLQ